MPFAPLRLVHSRAPEPVTAAGLTPDARPAPLSPAAPDGPFRVAALASFGAHALILAGMILGGFFGEERAAGTGEDVILIESVPVELVERAPMPVAPPSEAVAEAEPSAEPVEEAPAPVEEVPGPVEPIEPEVQAQPAPMPAPPMEAVSPRDASIGELPARSDEEPPVADAEAVPTPQVKPERPKVAEAETPPVVKEEPKEAEPVRKAPAAPPPSAPSAAAVASTQSGGKGGGGAAQSGGSSTASAYRAKVAAQLKRKRFYPNAARRDRLTGTATVSFTLNASGGVTGVRVVRSSGERVLDEAAVEMVRRAAPYPPIPAGLGRTITIQAPIAFDLPR